MKLHGKFSASPQRLSRICPVCGKQFDAKNTHVAVCNRCKQMWNRNGQKHRRGRFT